MHGCSGWADHGHRDTHAYRSQAPVTKAADLGEGEREAAKAARRHITASNKDWQAAIRVRREWLRRFGTRKPPPNRGRKFPSHTQIRAPPVRARLR